MVRGDTNQGEENQLRNHDYKDPSSPINEKFEYYLAFHPIKNSSKVYNYEIIKVK